MHRTGINCTLYEAMFGKKLKVGLNSSSISHEARLGINLEEKLEKLKSTVNGTIHKKNQIFLKLEIQTEYAQTAWLHKNKMKGTRKKMLC